MIIDKGFYIFLYVLKLGNYAVFSIYIIFLNSI